MFTRSSISMIALFFALFAATGHAKVAPSVETQVQTREHMLQQLINQPQDSGACEIAQFQGSGAERDAGSIETLAFATALTDNLNDACPIPAPIPNPFENLASL